MSWYDYHDDNDCDGYGNGHFVDYHKGYNDEHDPVLNHEADYQDHDDGDNEYDLCQGNCYSHDHDHDDHDLHDHQCHDNGYGHYPDHAYDCNSDHLQNFYDNYDVDDGCDGDGEDVDGYGKFWWSWLWIWSVRFKCTDVLRQYPILIESITSSPQTCPLSENGHVWGDLKDFIDGPDFCCGVLYMVI